MPDNQPGKRSLRMLMDLAMAGPRAPFRTNERCSTRGRHARVVKTSVAVPRVSPAMIDEIFIHMRANNGEPKPRVLPPRASSIDDATVESFEFGSDSRDRLQSPLFCTS